MRIYRGGMLMKIVPYLECYIQRSLSNSILRVDHQSLVHMIKCLLGDGKQNKYLN